MDLLLKTSAVTIEAHSYTADPQDLSAWTQSANWSFTTSAGSGGASIRLKIPLALMPSVIPSEPGWWLVIRNPSGRALWWGRVSSVSAGRSVTAAGAVISAPVVIQAEDFVSLVAQSQIILAAGAAVPPIDGAVYNWTTWNPALQQLLKVFEYQNPGGLFAELWRLLARVRLPPSLGGLAIGDAIPVGVDALSVSPDRAAVHVEVPGLAVNAVANSTPRGSVWSFLSGSFSADPRLVELFTSLDTPGLLPGPLAAALGGVEPVLNYRLRPLLTEPLVSRQAIAAGVAVPVASALSALPLEGVIDISMQWSDAQRLNGFFAQSAIRPGSQMAAYGVLGSPDFDFLDVITHGLRMYDLDWPFFPNDLEGAALSALSVKIDGLIALTKAVLGDGQAYARGSISMRYTPTLSAGAWYLVDIGALPRFWRCYASEVSHSVAVNPGTGAISKRTSIQFERGHYFP